MTPCFRTPAMALVAGLLVLIGPGLAGAAPAPAPSGNAPATAVAPSATSERIVLAMGHVDVPAVALRDGAVVVYVSDGSTGASVERDPEDVLFHVSSLAATTVPDADGFDFLGPPGSPVWVLPQVQDPSLLWPGWSMEEVPLGALAGDQLTWSLLAVEGPGAFSLFTVDGFGTVNRLFDSSDGLPDGMALPAGQHAHGNWAFTAPGEYRLTIEIAGASATGELVTSGPVALTFHVGDLPVPPPPSPGEPVPPVPPLPPLPRLPDVEGCTCGLPPLW